MQNWKGFPSMYDMPWLYWLKVLTNAYFLRSYFNNILVYCFYREVTNLWRLRNHGFTKRLGSKTSPAGGDMIGEYSYQFSFITSWQEVLVNHERTNCSKLVSVFSMCRVCQLYSSSQTLSKYLDTVKYYRNIHSVAVLLQDIKFVLWLK